MYDQFEAKNTAVIAIAQEDQDLESHAKFMAEQRKELRFRIVADLNRAKTTMLDHTTTYLIDRDGVVRQIFPATVTLRPDWRAVLNELERLELK